MMGKMKDSGVEWIGEIPEGWEVKRIGTQVYTSQEKAIYTEHFYIGLENIESSTGRYLESEFVPESLGNTFKKGDILFGKLRPYLNKCLIAPKDGLASSEIFVLNAYNRNNSFFRYLFTSEIFINILSSMTYGAKMPRINWPQFKDILVLIPPTSIQQKISTYLDRKCAQIDAILATIQKSIEILKEYRQAVITQAVTKGLDPDAKMQESGVEWIGEIPEGWETHKLGRILIKNDGGFWGNEPTGENDIIVLRSTEQKIDGELNIEEPALRNFYDTLSEGAFLKEGDLLLTKSSGSEGHIGKTSFITKEVEDLRCTFSNFMQRLRVDSGICSKLIFYMLNSKFVREQFNYLSNTTSGLGNINSSLINNVIIPISKNLTDQQKIATYLDQKTSQIDALISEKQTLHDKFTAYKKSLIYEYVTGKREVPDIQK